MLVFALLFTGCAQKASDNTDQADDTTQADDAQDVSDDAQDDAEQSDADAEQGQTDAEVSQGLSPAESYNRFVAAKSAGYDTLSAKIEENDMIAMTIGMQMVAVTMIDMSALDLTFLSEDEEASEMAAAMMNIEGFDITYSGQDFQMTYTGSEGQTIVVEGKYDGATDSLTATWTSDGSETLAVEYVTYNDGYAGQYLTYDTDGTAGIIKVIVDGADIGFGFSDAGALTSIYKSAPADFSFLDDCETIVTVQGGVGTSVYEGETTTF
jgi:hypothetical protein